MIKPNQITQQMIDLQKTSFLGLYNAASSIQKQASSAMDLMLNQVPWIPEEGRQVVSDWLGACQQEGDRFKAYVEKSFANLGSYFSPQAVAKTTKAAKPPADKVKKVSAAKAKKAVAGPAKKASPEVGKMAEPVETKTAKTIAAKKAAPAGTEPEATIPVQKADVPKKQEKTVLK